MPQVGDRGLEFAFHLNFTWEPLQWEERQLMGAIFDTLLLIVFSPACRLPFKGVRIAYRDPGLRRALGLGELKATGRIGNGEFYVNPNPPDGRV